MVAPVPTLIALAQQRPSDPTRIGPRSLISPLLYAIRPTIADDARRACAQCSWMKSSTSSFHCSGCSQNAAWPASGMSAKRQSGIRLAIARILGGAAYRSALPAIISVGTWMVVSRSSVNAFLIPSWLDSPCRLALSISTQRSTPFGSAFRYVGPNSRNHAGSDWNPRIRPYLLPMAMYSGSF